MLKKNLMKRCGALLMATAMLAVSGCGQQGTDSQESQTKEAESKSSEGSEESQGSEEQQERVTLTIAVPTDDSIEDFDTNYYTQVLEEAANVDLEFVMMPISTDYKDKLSLMISSGEDLPDIFIHNLIGADEQLAYGQAGYFLPLTEYFNDPEAMPTFYANVPEEDRQYMISYMTQADGNIYSAPNYVPQPNNEYSYRVWINVDWLEAVDMDMPTTTDEFYEVLKAFREKDPNGNGIADEIPMVGAKNGWRCQPLNFLMNAFEYVGSSSEVYCYVEDGKIVPAFATDAWKEGLTWINKLVSEELLSPLTFTQEDAQMQAMIQNEEVQLVGCYAAGGDYHSSGATSAGSYELLAPLTGPDGTCYATYSASTPDGRFVITKDCENVDAAVRLMDAFYDTEISMIARQGEPEVDWTTEIPEGYKSPYEDSLGVKTGFVEINNIWTTVQNKQWNWAAPMYRGMLDSWSRQGVGLPVTDDTLAIKVAKILGEFVDKHPDVITKLVHDEADQAEYADLKTVIKTYVQESNTRFIVGELPLSEWDEHIETLNDMGMERFVELTQKAYENANMN